jgi:hypothetical protein
MKIRVKKKTKKTWRSFETYTIMVTIDVNMEKILRKKNSLMRHVNMQMMNTI